MQQTRAGAIFRLPLYFMLAYFVRYRVSSPPPLSLLIRLRLFPLRNNTFFTTCLSGLTQRLQGRAKASMIQRVLSFLFLTGCHRNIGKEPGRRLRLSANGFKEH